MAKKERETTSSRRDFLKVAGATTIAAPAALAAAGKPAEAAEHRADGSRGYRETAHVKNYYKLARF